MRKRKIQLIEQQTAPNKTDEKNSFCGEVHCETYAALLHHNLPKTKTILQLRQSKVAKTETATGNNMRDQCYILAHSAYAERRGSCKMASFSECEVEGPVILSLCRRARKERSLGDDAHLHRLWRCLV